MSRHAVSGTEYLSHEPVKKKKTIRDRSSARRSCGRVFRRRSAVIAAHPPSTVRAFIHSTSVVFAVNFSRSATIEILEKGVGGCKQAMD
jgi:hypothetical protein